MRTGERSQGKWRSDGLHGHFFTGGSYRQCSVPLPSSVLGSRAFSAAPGIQLQHTNPCLVPELSPLLAQIRIHRQHTPQQHKSHDISWCAFVSIYLSLEMGFKLTIILAENQRVNAPEPKDIEKVPGCRTHPSKTRVK